MAKKSRKTAARYSELSKAGKKKQKAKGPAQTEFQADTEIKAETKTEIEIETQTQAQPQPEIQAPKRSRSQTVSVSTSRETVQPRGARGPVPRARSEAKLAASGAELVRADLKRIGILAGIMLIILIILAFTLG
jgi:hypothetical protein